MLVLELALVESSELHEVPRDLTAHNRAFRKISPPAGVFLPENKTNTGCVCDLF